MSQAHIHIRTHGRREDEEDQSGAKAVQCQVPQEVKERLVHLPPTMHAEQIEKCYA